MENLGYGRSLFLLILEMMDISATTSFYQSVLRAWSLAFKVAIETQQHLSVVFYSPMIQIGTLNSLVVQTCFVRAGLTTLGSLWVRGSLRTVANLGGATGVRSSRLLLKVLYEVNSTLPENVNVLE